VYLALFVDHGLLAFRSEKVLDLIIDNLSETFEITTGDASYFQGLQINYNRDGRCMFISQSIYIDNILNYNRDVKCMFISQSIYIDNILS